MKTELKANVIGLVGAATLGVVMLSPAMTLYGVFGPAFLSAGKAAPLAFIWALIATLPTALSYALLSREYPVSGSAAQWSAQALSPRVGVWAGWIVFLYYFTNFVIQPVTMGVFTGNLFETFHLSSGYHTYLIGIFICCTWSAWMVYRGISLSAKGALAFLIFESAVVLALCATVVFKTKSSLMFEGFHVAASSDGTSGLFRAVIFGMLAYCGFDVVSTLAEETKMAKKLIPQATLLSLFMFSIAITFGIWALTYGGTAESLKAAAASNQMPITQVALSHWGRGAILVTLTAISASLGLAIATAVGASRILFSMGRAGLASEKLSQLHPQHSVPWNALHVIFIGGIVGSIGLGAAVGQYTAYVWWGTTSTFFAMLTFVLVNCSCMILFRERSRQSVAKFFVYACVPFFGLTADVYLLIRSFFIELWAQDWMTGKSVVLFDVGCALVALIAALKWKTENPSNVTPATQPLISK